jgi:hypothetical protein
VEQQLAHLFGLSRSHVCINSSRLEREFRKTPFHNQPHIKQAMLIITRMKVEYSQLNICNPNSGHSPAELDGTGDPDGTPAPVEYEQY